MTAEPSEASRASRSDEEHLRRDAVLEAIRNSAASLVRASRTEEAIPAVLEQLGRATDACRVVLDRYLPGPDGETFAQTLDHWSAPGTPPPADLVVGRPVPLRGLGLDAWLERIRSGDLVEGTPDDFPRPVGDMLRAWGVRSVLAVPIVMERRLTGLLALAACHEIRTWFPPEKDALRVYAGIIGSFLQRVEADQALRRSEERYRQIVESSPGYVWEIDAEGRVTYCSERVRDILGHPPESQVGRTPFEFLSPGTTKASSDLFRSLAARRESFRLVECPAISATGETIWLSSSGAPILDEAGALVGYRGITVDITAHKRAEAVLRASEERYRGLVESQRYLIVRWTPDLRLVFANEAYFRLFGLDRAAVVGRPILESAPPEAAEMIRRTIQDLSAPPFHVAHEQHAVTVDGRRWLSWESFAIRDDEGRIVEIQAIGRDITRERAAAEEVRRRDRILAAVNAAAERLLGAASWEDVITEGLEQLGRATGVARVRYWEFRTLEPGRRAVVLRASWESPGGPANADSGLDGPFYLDDAEFLRLVNIVDQTQGASFRVEDVFCAPVTELLRSRGFLGFCVFPVLVHGVWRGLMTIAHDKEPTTWSAGEEDALRTACNILGAAIHRQQIESSLRDSEEKYRTLVEGANQPIIIVSYDGVMRFANGTAASQLGFSTEQLVGRSMWSLFPREHADSHMRAIRRAIDAGRLVVSTHRSVVQERTGWYEARIQPLAGAWKEQRAAIVLISDVTERKATERQLLEYQSRLRSLTSEVALAEQRERRRIASELHDRIGQSLAMARIKLGGVRDGDSEPILNEVRALLDQSIGDARTLTFELSPPILHELGLEPALEWLLERFAARHSFSTSFHGDGQPVELPGDVLGLVFQSVQELLINVAKHARARAVEITLDRGDGFLRVEVADDGIGAAPARTARAGRPPGGFGLFSIRERLETLGGSFAFESRPGKGTRAQLRVPLRPSRTRQKRRGRR